MPKIDTKQAFFVEICVILSIILFFLYKVIIYNDDFTTMEFVVHVLNTVFYKSQPEAEALMLDVHERGSAVVGVYSYDIATSRVRKATIMAREQNFPLRLECKPE